jgi:hypothetical protein
VPDSFPEMSQGDIETATIFTRAMRKIQGKFSGIAINTTAEIGQAVSDHEATNDHPLATTSAKGFLSGADKTKLDTVESGATADQTKADIDALNIDADTLDGIDSLGFDAAGAADTAVSDHVALADPHAQYALESKTPVDFGSTNDDVDTLVKSGFYRIQENANRPPGSDYGQLIVSRGGDTILQIVSNFTGKLWQRSGNPSNTGGNGSYSDWQEIPSLAGGASANFTAMPQVGGDPIVESGSNADGEWTRWSDGTQICTLQSAIVNSAEITWTYPVVFSVAQIYVGVEKTGAGTGQTKQTVMGGRTTSSVLLNLYDADGVSNDSADITALATGRWK